MTGYVVLQIITELPLQLGGAADFPSLNFSNDKNSYGVLLCYRTREKALKMTDGRDDLIMEVQFADEKPEGTHVPCDR